MRTGLATTIDAWPLAARMASTIGPSRNTWQVVISKSGLEVDAADALVAELESLIDEPVRRVAIHAVSDLFESVAADRGVVLVLSLESQWSDQDWRNIDLQRSRLMRKGMTILVVGEDDVATMVTSAPNLWSWVGGEVWALQLEEDRNG